MWRFGQDTLLRDGEVLEVGRLSAFYRHTSCRTQTRRRVEADFCSQSVGLQTTRQLGHVQSSHCRPKALPLLLLASGPLISGKQAETGGDIPRGRG